jgi:hypothetical protein
MQALEDSICANCFFCDLSGISPSLKNREQVPEGMRYTPQSQVRTFTARTAMPVPAATPASAFFRTRFAVSEAVAADHNRNQTCNLRNGAGEKGLNGGEAGVEG